MKTIFKQVCEGVRELHRASTVHGDLKTSNILISKQGNVVIADLGSASLVEPKTRGVKAVTTLLYRAPEQLFGPSLVENPLSMDVWSLGCILGELLLGRPMFYFCHDAREYAHALAANFKGELL